MDTFSSDYISSAPVGLTANVVRSIPREVPIPVKIPVFTPKHKKQIKDIQKSLLKIADLLSKVN
jgi:hypothetical protein